MRIARRRVIAPLPLSVLALLTAGLALAPPTSARGVSPKPGYYLGDSSVYTVSFEVSSHGARVTNLTTDFQANSENRGCMPSSEEIHVGSPRCPSAGAPSTDRRIRRRRRR